MTEPWQPRPTRLPDAHLPQTIGDEWNCRTCGTPWPCPTAQPHLTPGMCVCSSATYWEARGPRGWHSGPRCCTRADAMDALADELRRQHMAAPTFPPSHYYPEKPRRARRQCPPYDHTPGGPGDVRPGTSLWVRPGGLHPGWGNIHHLAVLTDIGPRCEIWLSIDSTVHRVRPDHLILEGSAIESAARARGVTSFRRPGARPAPLLPEWKWVDWTVAQHLAHLDEQCAASTTAVQYELFAALP